MSWDDADKMIFQSTLPTRGSDKLANTFKYFRWNFNPRSPRGGATTTIYYCFYHVRISIHAPHEGERPGLKPRRLSGAEISIHAPHEGERHAILCRAEKHINFNPRSPRGGATATLLPSFRCCKFQSTLPTRGSDNPCRLPLHGTKISIHAPHEGERHEYDAPIHPIYKNFNPRSPRGGATHDVLRVRVARQISIHAPHEGERRHTAWRGF